MHKSIVYVLVILAIFSISCASAPQVSITKQPTLVYFVISEDIPLRPTVVVLPHNLSDAEILLANTVEAELIRNKVRVLTRPGTKEVRVTSVGEPDTEARRIETSVEYEEFEADYVIHSYNATGQMRLVNKISGEVLSVLSLTEMTSYDVNNLLAAAGFIPREGQRQVLRTYRECEEERRTVLKVQCKDGNTDEVVAEDGLAEACSEHRGISACQKPICLDFLKPDKAAKNSMQ